MVNIILVYIPKKVKKHSKHLENLGYRRIASHYFIKEGFNNECKLDIDTEQKLLEYLDHEFYDQLPDKSKIYLYCSLVNKYKLTVFYKDGVLWTLDRKLTSEQIQKDSSDDN